VTIDDRGLSIGSNSAPERVNRTGHHRHSSGKPAPVSDSVDSASSPGFSALVSATLNAGSQDSTTRTEQLRQMVASGQYQIDTQALSRSVVDSMLKGY
jgi:anti-sigma28 factor (negative regulator of flagellin synthesis)